ncbi:protein sprouty homolog 4 [Nothoprocta perdicaria]|uniref:protein sprouty homolog 4 n=1 Tax=Nothoprocta perdicaria TaxID=30464 RepID=UPI000E1C1A2D|nr:protein sprouty homolog 4 [Nothoprocta perdicaria]
MARGITGLKAVGTSGAGWIPQPGQVGAVSHPSPPPMEPRAPVGRPAAPQPLAESRAPCGRPQPALPIEHVRAARVENDYSEQPARPRGARLPARGPAHATHPWISLGGRPGSVSSSGSASSEQRLLEHGAPGAAPGSPRRPPAACKAAELKAAAAPEPHALLCEACGKCKCKECAAPRALPSCWVCRQACLCSAQGLVNCSTCMCLVKGVFYHCADEDDEGAGADQPCSCAHADRCARWSFMSALALLLPCLLCYLPATGCVKLSQSCYDRLRRPGCRCRHTNSVLCKEPPGGKAASADKPF